MGILNVQNLKKVYGTSVILENISFEVGKNDKIGLVGANGAGKTTLFKILTSEIEHDGGQIFFSKDLKIGYMEQYAVSDENQTLEGELEKCFADVIQLEKRLNEINIRLHDSQNQTDSNIKLQAYLHDEFINSGGLYYKTRVSATLRGLGFSEDEFKCSVSTLSGGQRSKLALARLLLSGSNLLLLDEPTNHLDIESIEWLEGFLNDFDGAFIVISHDRYFLDRVTKRTFEIQNSAISIQDGAYSVFLEKKMGLDAAANKKYNDTLKEINRIEKIIAQQRQWNRERNIKTAESKQKQIDRLRKTLVKPQIQVQKLDFLFKAQNSGPNDVLEINSLNFGFEGKQVLKNIDLNIAKGERVFLYGANGSGKSTLFKIIAGVLKQNSESIKIGESVKIGYYDQAAQTLDFEKTIFDDVYDQYPKMSATEIRNALAVFLFKGDDVFLRISDISGGERAKVALLKVMLGGANFLLLDEPTNHLDISSKEALENALINYDGTLFMISHDRYFINRFADRILYLKDGEITEFLGNYDDFSKKRKQDGELNKPVQKDDKPADGARVYKEKKQQEAYIKTLSNKIKRAEREIEEIEKQIKDTQDALDCEENYSDYEKTTELFSQLNSLNEKHIQSLENWERLLAEFETLEK